MKTIAMVLFLFFVIIPVKKTDSCTIFFVEKDGIVLAGNNEDWKDPATMMFFYPPTQGKYGWVKFGWGSGFPQGGMNDHGLFWDGTAGPFVEMPKSEAIKRKLQIPIMQKVIEDCKNIQEAKVIFGKYYCEDQYRAQYLVGSSEGQSIIVEGDTILDKENSYQVLTNFYQTKPELGGFPCWRFSKTCEMLNGMEELDPNFMGVILSMVYQEGKYPTQYSNIYDLKNGIIYLFHLHNYNEFVKIDLSEELKKGEKSYSIPGLFSQVVNLTASVNKARNEVDFFWEGLPNSNYELIYSTNSDFIDVKKESVIGYKVNDRVNYYSVVYLFLFIPFLRIPRNKVVNSLFIFLFILFCGNACSKEELIENNKVEGFSRTVKDLESGQTYYWKICAKTNPFNNFASETVVNEVQIK